MIASNSSKVSVVGRGIDVEGIVGWASGSRGIVTR